MSSYKFVVAPLWAVGEVVSPFCIRTALALKELIGLAYAKSRREPERIVRVVVVDCAVGVHIHEIVGVARIRGTEPPISGAPCAVVLVFDLAVSGGVVVVLLLIIRLVCV